MIGRRGFTLGLAASASCFCCGVARGQWPGSTGARQRVLPVAAGGCGLNQEEGRLFLSATRFRTELGEEPLDEFFASCVASAEVELEVEARFAFFDDSDGPNAFATPYTIFGGREADGAVAFGETLLRSEQASLGSTARSALFMIVAHEYAHIRQFKEQRGGHCPEVELEADFLAGWVLGCETRLRTGRVTEVDISSAAVSVFAKGSYDYNDEQFHGTPEQRRAAVLSGFEFGRRQTWLPDAYRAALAHSGGR